MRRELVLRTFADVVEHEAWEGPATLELRPKAQVPVRLLRVCEVVLGLHRTLDLTLPLGLSRPLSRPDLRDTAIRDSV